MAINLEKERIVKLAITIEVDVDIIGWGDEYGVRGLDIKPDVADYIRTAIGSTYAVDTGLLTVTSNPKIVEHR